MNKDILNSEEIARVIMFNNDVATKNAIKKLLLADIYNSGTKGSGDVVTRNWAYNLVPQDKPISDTELGQSLRAMVMGLSFLEEAFKRLETYQTKKELEEETNPAV